MLKFFVRVQECDKTWKIYISFMLHKKYNFRIISTYTKKKEKSSSFVSYFSILSKKIVLVKTTVFTKNKEINA